MSGLLVPGLIGAAAWVAFSDDEKAAVAAGVPARQVQVISGTATPAIPGAVKVNVSNPSRVLALKSRIGAVSAYVTPGAGRYTNQGSLTAQQKIKEVEAEAKRRYAALSSEAKKKGAAALSKALKIEPPLDGTETWDAIGKRAGAAGGAAVCTAVPGAQLAVPLCAIAGAYFGEKLADWMADKWKDVSSYAKEAWSDVRSTVTDAAGDAYDTIRGWF